MTKSWLPSFPYPPSGPGYWDPVTSTLQWCEEDYYATHYAAEIVNTLTNILFQYLAFKGIRNCLKNGHDTIFIVTFVGYFLVGTGSFCFHATLKYPMQLVDELSMIYTTCLMFYATFSHRQTARVQVLLALFLVSLCIFITGYYHYLQDPRFHQNAYALLTAIVLIRSVYVMEVSLRPSLQPKQLRVSPQTDGAGVVTRGKEEAATAEQVRRDERDRTIVRTMWLLIGVGLSVFLGGFAIWNVDNVFCGTLRRWRREIGLPWGILLEGHGWWHLMTGTGAYFYITWGIWLRHCLNGKQDDYVLQWPRVASLPLVVRSDKSKVQDGSAKKRI